MQFKSIYAICYKCILYLKIIFKMVEHFQAVKKLMKTLFFPHYEHANCQFVRSSVET